MTGRAAGIAIVGAVAAAAGTVLQWAEVVAIGIALLSLLAIPWTLRRPRAASWTDIAAPTRVTRGDEASVIINVSLDGGSPTWVSAVDAELTDRVFLPRAASAASTPLAWPIDTARRGSRLVGPSRLEAGDPFGISRRVLATRDQSPVLIVPRVHPVDIDAVARSTDEGDSGSRSGGDSFESLREYAPGDPMKTVHWPSSARMGHLMVKRTVEFTTPWLLVVLDVNCRSYDREGALFADFDAEAFEQSVDTTASWAWHGCTTQQRVLLTTTAVDPRRPVLAAEVTGRTRESALDALAVVEELPQDQCGPGRVTALCRRQGIGQLVFITGRTGGSSRGWPAAWRRHVPVTTIVGHA